MVNYYRTPTNDINEIHICVRCSDSYAKYAPVVFYSILCNNPEAYVYIYVFTDGISDKRWEDIKTITALFPKCEIHQIYPQKGHLEKLKVDSKSHHGWGLIHISIFYELYLPRVRYCFNIGIDTLCVGDLSTLLEHVTNDQYLVGACTSTRHQSKSSLFQKKSWMGFDTALINFDALRHNQISPEVLISKSVGEIGYIHDEVAFNINGKRLFLNEMYYYIYTGSFRPNKSLKPETVLVDFYSELKPWDIAVSGYKVFDLYIEYYNVVGSHIQLEFELPENFITASVNLKNKGFSSVYWLPIRLPIASRFLFRVLLLPSYAKKVITKLFQW